MTVEIERIIVVGTTGTGKTTWSKNYVRLLQSQHPERFFLIADIHSYYPCRERFYTAGGPDGFLKYFEKDDLQPGIYCFTLTRPLDWDAFFQLVLDVSGSSDVPARPLLPCTLVVDELIDHSDAYSTQEKLLHIFRFGRHAELSFICCTMRPKNVDGMLLNNANRFICFKQGRVIDVEALRAVTIIGDGADDLLSLEGHDYIEFPRVKKEVKEDAKDSGDDGNGGSNVDDDGMDEAEQPSGSTEGTGGHRHLDDKRKSDLEGGAI